MKKIIVGTLCSTILLGTFLPTSLVGAEQMKPGEYVNSALEEEQLVPIEVYSDENTLVIADVPKSYEKEYRKKLENEEFKQQEIEKNAPQLNNDNSRVATRAASVTTRYMRKAEIIKIIDSIDKSFDWSKYISNPLGDALVVKAISQITKSNFFTAAITATVWAAVDLQARQEAWWKDSAVMILKGKITGVKLEIKENTASEYPKVFRTLTRY